MRSSTHFWGRRLVAAVFFGLFMCLAASAEEDTCYVPDPGLQEAVEFYGSTDLGAPPNYNREALAAIGYIAWPSEYGRKTDGERGFAPSQEGEGEGEGEQPWEPEFTPIADLTGLECATGLKWLYLSSQPISDFSPIASLPELQSLSVGAPITTARTMHPRTGRST